MAWHVEQETGDIVIDGFDKGTAPDPYSGMGRMFSVNLETSGEVTVGYPITTSTVSGATLGNPIARSVRYFPTYITQGLTDGSVQSYTILDATGQVFESTSISGTWTYLSSGATLTGASNLDGIAYWLGYLFKFRNDKIDYWNGTTWSNAWKTITGGVKHFAYVASDNVLYFTNGSSIGKISAPTPASFDPTNAATYSFSASTLALPVSDYSLSIAEVGGGNSPQSTLLVGGAQNAIYPWDKVSSSFGLPIYVADSYIKKIVSANQNAFIFPGNLGGRGKIYVTNGSQADLYFKMPDHIFNIQDPYYEWGDAIFHRNNLVFGCFVDSNAQSVLTFAEVWALNLETQVFRSISSIPSVVTNKGNATVLIPATNPSTSGFSYILGWDDNGSAPKIGYSGTTAGVNSNGFTIYTDLIPVGTTLKKKTFSQIEYKLRTPLASGESLTIYPVYDGGNIGSAFVFDPTATSGSFSGISPMNLQNSQWLSFLVTSVGNSASSGVRLKEIRLR